MGGAARRLSSSEQKPRLLLVDDDPAFCEVLGRAMERRGFEVLRALDVGSALAAIRRSTPQYAIIDLCIGTGSGLPLVQALAQLDPEARIVVLTGFASVATAVEAIKLGACHYITKPTDPAEIVAAFEREQGDPTVPVSSTPLSVRRVEWEHIQKVLQEHEGNVSAAARAMGMHRRTLQRKLRKRPTRR